MFFEKFMAKVFGTSGAITVPPMDGALSPNQILEVANAQSVKDPDCLAIADGQIFYTSGPDLNEWKSGKVVHRFTDQITFITSDSIGNLAVGVADDCIHIVDAKRQVTPLKNTTFKNATAACFIGTDLFVCESSDKNSHAEWARDLMEIGSQGLGNGAIWKITPDGAATKLISGLQYPAGIIGCQNGRLLVSLAWRHQIVSIDPENPAVPTIELSDLPGYPGRISAASDGGFWLSVFAPRSQLVEFVLREKVFLKNMLSDIDLKYWIAPALRSGDSFLEPLQGGAVKQMGIVKPWAPTRSYGLIVHLDEQFRPTQSLHSRADGNRHGTTSALEIDDMLLVACRGGNAILEVPATEYLTT